MARTEHPVPQGASLGLAPPRRYRGVNWRGLAAIIRRQVVGEIMFFRLAIFGPALQALLFASVIWIALGEAVTTVAGLPFLTFLAPGLIIAAGAQRAFESTAFSVLHEKLEGTIGDLWGAPLSPGEILAGYLISAMIVSVMIAAPTWAVLAPFGAGLPDRPLALLFFMTFGALILSVVGLATGMHSPKWDSLSAIETFAIAPLLFLSGSFFSLAALAEPFRSLMLFNPIFHLVNGFRFGMTGVADAPIGLSALVIGVAAVLALAFGRYLVGIGYKIKA
ncbi:MAG: ABC transporter permease [Alphaproteobacteria bacterium]|nr:ABC transporter permease [Alphaproteobacteria bacterium]